MKSSSALFITLIVLGISFEAPLVNGQTIWQAESSPTAAVKGQDKQGQVAQEQSKPPSSELVISDGDLLEIGVFGADYSCMAEKGSTCQVRVSSAGQISLPLIGPVKVAGMTVTDAEESIAKRLSDGGYFKDPQVSILQKEFATQGISVMGEVQKPGTYPLLGSHSLLEAISAAGGTTTKAGNTVTVVHRGRPNAPQTVDMTEPTAANVPVFPGDTILVAKAGIVYVVGDVKQPSGIVMDSSGLTILQAISMAQGTNPTAALDSAKLIRTTTKGREEIPVSLKGILASKAPDLELQAEDILFVPNSVAKGAARRSLDAILQVATGVVIYRR